MTLALGLGALFVGAASVIAGVTNRPISRLLFGYWDAPGTSGGAASAPGTAATGGVHAVSGAATQHSKGAYPTGGPSR